MAPKKKLKGLKALNNPEVTEIAKEGDVDKMLEEHRDPMMKFLDPFFQAAEEAVSTADAMLQDRDNAQVAVQKTRSALRDLEQMPDSRYSKLIAEQKRLEDMVNAKSRKVGDVNVSRLPDNSPVRRELEEISRAISEIRKNVGLYWAGVFGLDADEAFSLVRSENEYYQSKKN